MGCRDPKTNWGNNNLGGYCNPKVDELARKAINEPDEAKRDQDLAEAWRISLMDDVAYIPLHQQPLAWGVSKKLHVIQPPNNYYNFRWGRLD